MDARRPLNSAARARPRQAPIFAAAAACALACWLAYSLAVPQPAGEAAPEPADRGEPKVAVHLSRTALELVPSSPNPPSHPQPPAGARPLYAAPALEPSADDHPDWPHPLDETRRALARENRLIGALNDAMDLADPASMRPLIARYRQHVPADENALAAGYERIADCLEHPGEASREAAERYYRTERASTLRRYVRRHCFER